jgi:hypothetical protein
MDCRGQTRRFLIGAALAAVGFGAAATGAELPLRAARWLAPERQLQALSHEPTECLRLPADAQAARRVAIGRAAFRTPLLLGGQAARAGLSCNSCHRNGRNNPDLQFPGLSGAPGTADVTSSLMSSHRGDGHDNPTRIPDLSGPVQALKISREPDGRALETFIHGLIVEEFDGPEPDALTLDAVASYVRALSPQACPAASEQAVSLEATLSDARAAAHAAQYALDAHDPATARLMLASARSSLGLIDERYDGAALARDRELLRAADRELLAIQSAVDAGSKNASLRITSWLAKQPRWTATLQRDKAWSLFEPLQLAAHLDPSLGRISPPGASQ